MRSSSGRYGAILAEIALQEIGERAFNARVPVVIAHQHYDTAEEVYRAVAASWCPRVSAVVNPRTASV